MKTIFLNGDVGWEITAENILTQIDVSSKEKLQVIVNSPGGSVWEAFIIYNVFKSYAGQVEFVIMGIAMSAMSYVIMAGDKISAFKNSVFMAHRPWMYTYGDAAELRTNVDVLEKIENVMIEAYQTRLGGTRDEILTKMIDELWSIGWEDLTENGIIDNVIDKVEEIEIEEAAQEELSNTYAMVDVLENLNFSAVQIKGAVQIKKTAARMRDNPEDLKTDFTKIAAHFEAASTPAKEPDKNKITEATNVTEDLKTFLSNNPAAQAEYDLNLQSAMDKGKVHGDISTDRQRIVSILANAGVTITAEAATAINSGMSSGDFAESELQRQRANRAGETTNNAVDFGVLTANQTPAEQDPTGVVGLSDEDFDKETEKAAKMAIGGKL